MSSFLVPVLVLCPFPFPVLVPAAKDTSDAFPLPFLALPSLPFPILSAFPFLVPVLCPFLFPVLVELRVPFLYSLQVLFFVRVRANPQLLCLFPFPFLVLVPVPIRSRRVPSSVRVPRFVPFLFSPILRSPNLSLSSWNLRVHPRTLANPNRVATPTYVVGVVGGVVAGAMTLPALHVHYLPHSCPPRVP